MELVTGILAKGHSGFDEFVFIAETGKIAFYTESLCLVIEVSLMVEWVYTFTGI